MRSRWILAACLVACGYEQSNAIDLAAVDGMPVTIVNARMAESLYASLGGGPVHLSGSDRANAIGIAYDVKVAGAAAEYSGVTSRLACRVGDHTIVSVLATDASNRLVSAAPGTVLEQRDTFPPTPFADGIPTVCETTIYYTIAPPLAAVPSIGSDAPPDPGPEIHPLGTVCFADDVLTEGACSPDVLPRVAASSPIAISRVVGRIGSVQGGGYGVEVSVLATAGEQLPDRWSIGAEAKCKVGDAVKDVPIHLFMFGQRMRPGESFWQSGATPSSRAVASEPEWCTVDVLVAKDGAEERAAQHCIRGAETTEGACE